MQYPTRRRFLSTLAATPLAASPFMAQAALAPARELRFDNLHTGEKLSVEYFAAGRYHEDALTEINRLLRDFRTGDVGEIDPSLLDLLHALRQTTGTREAFQVISGYRSPATNAALHRKSNGVATRSLHMQGKAIDIRLGDVELSSLRRAALSLQLGGVGFYPGSNFVHVDTGRVRFW
ncbi:MAG: DUF882 domain-containing protein [Pseudomonadota bacterium]